MVDAADREKIEASRNELHNLLEKPQLQGIPVSCRLQCDSMSLRFNAAMSQTERLIGMSPHPFLSERYDSVQDPSFNLLILCFSGSSPGKQARLTQRARREAAD